LALRAIGTQDNPQTSPDPAKLYDGKPSPFLINREAIVPVAAAALISLIVAGVVHLPVKKMIGIGKHFAACLMPRLQSGNLGKPWLVRGSSGSAATDLGKPESRLYRAATNQPKDQTWRSNAPSR
jgi:hypothetical protein